MVAMLFSLFIWPKPGSAPEGRTPCSVLPHINIPTWRTVKQPVSSAFGVSFDGNKVLSPTCLVEAFYRDACVNVRKVARASSSRFVDQDKAAHFGSSFALISQKFLLYTLSLQLLS